MSPKTPEQLSAIEFPLKGNLFLEAGAGSGKTQVIIERIKYLCDQGIHKDHILVVTFTVAAAKEIEERCQKIALVPKISTIDALFHSLLLDLVPLSEWKYKSLIPFPWEEFFSSVEISSLIKDYYLSVHESQNLFQSGIETLLYNENFLTQKDPLKMIGKDAHPYAQEFFDEARTFLQKKYQEWISLGIFNHSLRTAFLYENLKTFPYPLSHLIVDEYQDTSKLQHELFMRIQRLTSCYCYFVGDRNQGIYGFRNAKKDNISLLQTHKDWSFQRLPHNFRSSPSLLKILNTLNRFIFDETFEDQISLQIKETTQNDLTLINVNVKSSKIPLTQKILDSLYIHIDRIRKEYHYSWKDCCIICENNSQIQLIKEHGMFPTSLNFPYSFEEKLFSLLLKAYKKSIETYESFEIFRYIKIPLQEIKNHFQKKQSSLKISSFFKVLEETHNLYEYQSVEGWVFFLRNLHLNEELLSRFLAYTYSQKDFPQIKGSFYHYPAPQDAINLSTVHGAKGLQWPIVAFWPGRNQKRSSQFLMEVQDNSLLIQDNLTKHFSYFKRDILNQEDQPILESLEDLSELNQRKNVFYTAITRAQSKLILVCPRPYGRSLKSLDLLGELPQKLEEKIFYQITDHYFHNEIQNDITHLTRDNVDFYWHTF
jgi:superfamily I DNA/RNA helicase